MFGGGNLWGGSDQGGLVSEVGVHEKMASSVKEYAYTEDKNFRYRPTMEDSKLFKLLRLQLIASKMQWQMILLAVYLLYSMDMEDVKFLITALREWEMS